MENLFVTYNLSLTLKELGFDEPCWAWYHIADQDIRYCYSDQRSPIKNSEEEWYAKNENREIEIICIPTYSQAFRWFRDKNYEVYYSKKEDGTITFRVEYGHWDFISDESFLDYEKAESVCLKKLIEINIIQNQSRQK